MIVHTLTDECNPFFMRLNAWFQREFNISMIQFFLLKWLISQNGETTMSKIAETMGHSTAAATGMIDRLEKFGYVERTHAVDDRRKVLVRVIEGGQKVVHQGTEKYQSSE